MLFTIHHVACSGGSIISQAIAASTNSVLISEINPYGKITRKAKKLPFNPTNIIVKLVGNSQELSRKDKLEYFTSQLYIAKSHVNSISKNLLIRDHSHSTFNFHNKDWIMNGKKIDSRFLESLKVFYEKYQVSDFKLNRPIISIRHPLDSYISAYNKDWLGAYCGENKKLDRYCESLINFQKKMVENEKGLVIRYEDFCIDLKRCFNDLFSNIDFDWKLPSIEDINRIKVTGKSGRKSYNIGIRKRKHEYINKKLIDEINNSEFYSEYCKLNNYNPNYQSEPLMEN